MKNFFFIGLIVIASISCVDAREAFLPDPSVVIDTGFITDPALLASSSGEVFIEFSTSTKFVHEEGFISFNGEILPPAVIELPDQRPRLRMEPIVSFELGTDSGEQLLFLDRIDVEHAQNLLREEYVNPGTIARSSWVKLIVPIEDEFIGRPQLWEYIGPEKGWAVIGGIMDLPSPEGVRVFSAILRRTGVYTLFDEDPAPKHFADEFDGSMENIDPNFSDINSEEFWNESYGELPEGMTWEESQSLTLDGQSNFREDLTGFEDVPEAQIAVHNRAITMSEKTALEARKLKLIAQLSYTEKPEDLLLLKELLTLIERKIIIADQRENLIRRQELVSTSLANALNEQQEETFSEQLAMIEAQLAGLEDVVLERRITEIEESLEIVVEKKVVTVVTPPVIEPEPTPEPEIEIPEEAELPQTGTESMNGNQSPSLVFPIALFIVLLFVIASGVIASQKRTVE